MPRPSVTHRPYRPRLAWHHGLIITSATWRVGRLTVTLYSGVDALDGRWSVEVLWNRRCRKAPEGVHE